MPVQVTREVSLGNIMMAATFLLAFGGQAIGWAWHEAGQTKDIEFIGRQVDYHNGLDWHDAADTRMSKLDTKLQIFGTKLDTTNKILEEIKSEIEDINEKQK